MKTSNENETPCKKNGRRPQTKTKEDLLKNVRRSKKDEKNGRRPQAQLKKSTLISCDIIVN